jgi:hypothetical protein
LGTLLIGTLYPFPPFYLLIGPCWWSTPSTSLLLGDSIPTFFPRQIQLLLFCKCIIFGVNPLFNFAPSPFFIMEWVL